MTIWSELFQRASEDIRLRTEEDDWDKIQKGLLPDSSSSPSAWPRMNTRRNFVFGICLFGFLCIAGESIFLVSRPGKKMLINQSAGKSGEKNSIDDNHSLIPGKKRTGAVYQANQLPETRGILETTKSSDLNPKPLDVKQYLRQNEAGEINTGLTPFMLQVKQTTISVPRQPDSSKSGSAKETPDKIRRNGMYVGVVAGPQFSRTKQQGFSDAGLSTGILAGIHLNKIFVESGLIISDKKYVSGGQYFDMNKIASGMPSGMKLIQVQSKSTVLEIPLKVGYEVLTLNKGAAFATAGLTSFILTSENNQYSASVNGNSETMTGHYTTHQNYFAAALNMSIGYECYTSRNINIRIEPYLQIPLKSIGMGSMHVVSAGAYIGITIPVAK